MHRELYRNYNLFNCLKADHQNSANLDFIRLFIHGITFIKLGFGERLNEICITKQSWKIYLLWECN